MVSDHYSVLGLRRGASEAEIRSAFLSEAKRWHPDKAQEEKKSECTAHFQRLQTAYEALGGYRRGPRTSGLSRSASATDFRSGAGSPTAQKPRPSDAFAGSASDRAASASCQTFIADRARADAALRRSLVAGLEKWTLPELRAHLEAKGQQLGDAPEKLELQVLVLHTLNTMDLLSFLRIRSVQSLGWTKREELVGFAEQWLRDLATCTDKPKRKGRCSPT